MPHADPDPDERAYLQSALAADIDRLLNHPGPEARALVRVLALADEPVTLDILREVWREVSRGIRVRATPEQEAADRLDDLYARIERYPPEVQERLRQLQPEVAKALAGLAPGGPIPDPLHLLQVPIGLGLVTVEHPTDSRAAPVYACHELVRERARLQPQPTGTDDRGHRSANEIRLAYARCLEGNFRNLLARNPAQARKVGCRALTYLAQAGADERLGTLALALATSAVDAHALDWLIPDMQIAVESAPEGQARWTCRCRLADALDEAGRPDTALPLYARSAAEAESAGCWPDLAWICGNWAKSLRGTGRLDEARARRLGQAQALRRAGSAEVRIVAAELESLRIGLQQGRGLESLPEIEARVARLEGWWRALENGAVQDVSDRRYLQQVLLGALDIARQARFALKDWPEALAPIERRIAIQESEGLAPRALAPDRLKRAQVLTRLGRFPEARTELDACLALSDSGGDQAGGAKALSSLADMHRRQGDIRQAVELGRQALAIRNRLPDARERASAHNNLAVYLQGLGGADARAVARHQLAALAYQIGAGLDRELRTTLDIYAIRLRRNLAEAAAPARRGWRLGLDLGLPWRRPAPELPAVPRLAQVLADPEFVPLASWLQRCRIDPRDLQDRIDRALAEIWVSPGREPGPSDPDQGI